MKAFFSLLVLMGMMSVTASAAADDVELQIVCGDVQQYYVRGDLSKSFLDDYYSPDQKQQLVSQGFQYAYGGRNCGLGDYGSGIAYDVLLLTKTERFLLRDVTQIFPVGTDIYLTGNLDATTDGIVLTGIGKNIHSADGTVQGRISSPRVSTFQPVVVIVRLKRWGN